MYIKISSVAHEVMYSYRLMISINQIAAFLAVNSTRLCASSWRAVWSYLYVGAGMWV